MITLYRQEVSRQADEIKERLVELVLAHHVVVLGDERPADLPNDTSPPILIEGDEIYAGSEISELLDELAMELRFERQFSADACFLDPNDPTRCI